MTTENMRNLHPTPQARFAMMQWSARYARQRGGSMDFWDTLTDKEKQFCHEYVRDLFKSSRPSDDEDTFTQVLPNEWVTPKRKGYRLSCCDCGLTHEMDFRTVKDQHNRTRIQFRARR